MSGDIKNNAALTESHNRLQRVILETMVKETLVLGGTMASVMVLLESVATGVLMARERLEGHPAEESLAALVAGINERLASAKAPLGKAN